MWPFDKALLLALRKRQRALRVWKRMALRLQAENEDQGARIEALEHRIQLQRGRLSKFEGEAASLKGKLFAVQRGPHNEKSYGPDGVRERKARRSRVLDGHGAHTA